MDSTGGSRFGPVGSKDFGCHNARTRLWKELALKYGWKTKNHGLPAGSVAVPEEDILADPVDAVRLLQQALTRTGISRPASGANSSLWSPRSEDKKPKRRRSSAAKKKNKRAKTDAPKSWR
nr:uncharacterized protein LOC117279161 [Nicotiana tomentosiformis]